VRHPGLTTVSTVMKVNALDRKTLQEAVTILMHDTSLR
jgi:hypothetical protein